MRIFTLVILDVVAPSRFFTEVVSTHAWHSRPSWQRYSWGQG